MLITAKKDRARFWAKVEKGPGCWGWTAAVNTSGYGRGADNNKTVLTDADVLAIRAAYVPGSTRGPGTMLQIAKRFGINRTTVSAIVTRKTWRHLP